jgi:hypothetical protein
MRMRPLWKGWPLLLALGVALAAVAQAPAAVPLAGSWNLALIQPGQEITLCLVKVEDRAGKPSLRVLGGADIFSNVSVEDVESDEHFLRCTLRAGPNPFRLTLCIPPGGDRAATTKGSLLLADQAEALVVSRTDATEYDQKKAFKQSDGAEDLGKAMQSQDAKEQARLLTELIDSQKGKPVTLPARQILLAAKVQAGEEAAKLEAAAAGYLQQAAEHGPGYEQYARLEAARLLVGSEKGASLALKYARAAEKEIPDSDTPRTIAMLKVLSRALHRAGREAEAKPVDARLEAKESALDEEFRKKAVPFEPEAPAPRSGKSDRVVLVELFTGAQCPPCVAADVAFDAALMAYKPADVALLQYHLHVPGPDPLTSPDSEARAEHYNSDIPGTPATLLNGRPTRSLGGPPEEGKTSYGTLRSAIDQARNRAAEASLSLEVKRAGDRIDLQADVSNLRRTGDKVRLRFVLVEEVVRYAGSNRQRLHHHVVRAFPGGVKGVALEKNADSKTASITLADLKKQLGEYLDKAAEQQPFPDEDRPLKLEHFKVVAFIQDDATREVLQAAQADVSESK